MRYEAEDDILQDISKYQKKDICPFARTQLEFDVIRSIQKYKDVYTDNSGHDCYPPDYYSDDCKIMFDVMRINDSEKKKSYNPVMKKERELEKEIREAFAGTNISERALTNGLVINTQPDENYDKAHNYRQYCRQYLRTIKKHLEQVVFCRKVHPGHKMGFLIFDETDLYMELENIFEATKPWIPGTEARVVDLHFPLRDKTFMQPLLDSDLDFVIWAMPYKLYSGGPYELPRLCVVDLKNYDKNVYYKEYNKNCLRSR